MSAPTLDPAILERDRELVGVAKDIKVLSHLAWPVELQETFLVAWRAGRPELPSPPPVDVGDLPRRAEVLERLSRPAGDHPAARFVASSARSFLLAVRLLENAGTPAFQELSQRIYGCPTDPVLPGGLTSLAAAEHFCAETEALAQAFPERAEDYCLTAETVLDRLSLAFSRVFIDAPLKVRIDPGLAAKAAAGAERVRIRSGTCFSEADVAQLIEHEGLVHAATLRNGRRQPQLTCLGVGAPRTTATQEGLATFAELITTHMDLARLRRIALRIAAVHRAQEGADFIDVFRFFLESGYPEEESFASTQRIFRGGDVRGGVAFTKDVVYLRGLLQTHAWIHTALAARKVDHPRRLFAGRLTWSDVDELEPCFADGTLAPPRYEPGWVARQGNLAAYLALSNLTHLLPVAEAELTDFVTRRLRRIEDE